MSILLKYESKVNRIITNIIVHNTSGSSYEIKALWDTGASTSCIKNSLANQFNLSKNGVVKDVVSVGASPVDRDSFLCDVSISNEIKFHEIEVITLSDDTFDKFDFIIGMNIINKGKMIIDGLIGSDTYFEFTNRI